jgi:hypothetical protein
VVSPPGLAFLELEPQVVKAFALEHGAAVEHAQVVGARRDALELNLLAGPLRIEDGRHIFSIVSVISCPMRSIL